MASKSQPESININLHLGQNTSIRATSFWIGYVQSSTKKFEDYEATIRYKCATAFISTWPSGVRMISPLDSIILQCIPDWQISVYLLLY